MFFDGFPFGGMPGMGGMGGMGGPGGRRAEVDNNKFYDVLGVSKDADATTIKKAYRKLALAHHPDRGGDEEKFKEISKAHETLTDPDRRRIYDEQGEEGLESGGGGGPGGAGFNDVFSAMFGGGGGPGGARRGPRRGEDVTHKLEIPLAQVYSGTSKKMALFREVLCKTCKATGSKDGKSTTCTGCKGQGRRMVVQRMGNMIAQQTVTCTDCRGKGSVLEDHNKCGDCNGQTFCKEKEVLEVRVEKGTKDGQKITFKGKGDERPGVETGDVVFVIKVQGHDTFERAGDHLVISHKITLLEALTGFKFAVTHLDGRKMVLHSVKGQVYKPGDVLIAKGEGMPIFGRSYTAGHLVVKLDVEFPTTVNEAAYAKLAEVLPKGKEVKVTQDMEEHFLESGASIDLTGRKQQGGRGGNAYEEDDSDDEEGHGHGHGPQVGCTQA